MDRTLTAYRVLYALFLLCIGSFLSFRLLADNWLQTDLSALLPKEQRWVAVQQAADHHQEQQLNRQFVALIGHSHSATAFHTAQKISQQWEESGLFSQIDSQTQPNLSELQHQIHSLSFATLPTEIRNQLLDSPQIYFQHYAEQIIDPFNHTNFIPLEQDWFGFGRFVLTQEFLPNIQWDSQTGMIYLTYDQKTWVLLRGLLSQDNPLTTSSALLDLIQKNEQTAFQVQGQFLAASTAIFAAQSKQKAEAESTLMSTVGISLTLLLLFALFRSWRILWLFLPIGCGMAAGVAAVLGMFGQVHILTLVIGTSLIGVLIDFPLHWLSSSLFSPHWHALHSMAQLKRTFLISLFVTLLGYGLLGFTALPILQQTALFSAAALLTAIGCTLLFLPPLFAHYQARPISNWLDKYTFNLGKKTSLFLTSLLLVALGIGLWKSQWQDDIRQWIAISPTQMNQLQHISQITGIEFGRQYFLITAENDEALLNKSGEISQKLNALQAQGKIEKFQSLNQWLMSQAEQTAFAKQLSATLQSRDYQPLTEIGLPIEPLITTQKNLPNRPLVSLQQALETQIGQGWQTLYLGELEPHKVAALIKVSGVKDEVEIAGLSNQQDVFWQNKRTHLNQSFQQTRNQAAWLKFLSFLIAGSLLWRLFGLNATIKMLCVPLVAIVGVIAIFGYLAIPIGLFTLFGLLLVSALSIDYTAYLHTAPERLADKRFAVLLAALTTMISFTLLGFSSTPAVATFGLSVSLGVALSLLLALKLKW